MCSCFVETEGWESVYLTMFYGMAIQLNLDGFLDIWHLTITPFLHGHLGYTYPCGLKSVLWPGWQQTCLGLAALLNSCSLQSKVTPTMAMRNGPRLVQTLRLCPGHIWNEPGWPVSKLCLNCSFDYSKDFATLVIKLQHPAHHLRLFNLQPQSLNLTQVLLYIFLPQIKRKEKPIHVLFDSYTLDSVKREMCQTSVNHKVTDVFVLKLN